MKSSLALAMLFLFLLLAAEPASAAPDRTLFDFESGTYAGWKVEGPAFGDAPFAVAKAQEWREDRRPLDMQGRFFVKTGETRHETTPDSALTSDEFETAGPQRSLFAPSHILEAECTAGVLPVPATNDIPAGLRMDGRRAEALAVKANGSRLQLDIDTATLAEPYLFYEIAVE